MQAICAQLRSLECVSAAVSTLDAVTLWLKPGTDVSRAQQQAQDALAIFLAIFTAQPTPLPARTHQIGFSRAALEGEFRHDLAALAAHSKLDESAWLARFCSAQFHVALIGFKPGFPYLLGLPEALAMPRLANPRIGVPAGSVAIGGNYAGIYPTRSPGGWRVIGITTAKLFNPTDAQPCLLSPGDHVRFLLEK